MRTFSIITWLVAALPLAGVAQEVPGLDLSQPPRPPDEQPPAEPPPGGQEAPIDLSKPDREPSASQKAREVEPGAAPLAPVPERDVALGDKVKAVQRKGFLKRGRFELAPIFALTVNDAFYEKFGYGGRLAYNVQDTFALAVRGAWYTPYRTDNVRAGKLALQSQLLSSQLYRQAMLDGVWSPIYGKAAFLDRQIVHFDLFLAAGFGAVWTSTSFAQKQSGTDYGYPHLATDFGGGVRFYPLEWLAFELGLMVTLFPDQPQLSVPSTIQKVFVANMGFSFFFPPSFEYVYP